MEVYRSGHNGPDSKSGIRQRIVGSNPTASAKTKGHPTGVLLFCFVGFERFGACVNRGVPLGVSVVSHRFRQNKRPPIWWSFQIKIRLKLWLTIRVLYRKIKLRLVKGFYYEKISKIYIVSVSVYGCVVNFNGVHTVKRARREN